jgi:transcriptional regulator with XRE-family HTH domain
MSIQKTNPVIKVKEYRIRAGLSQNALSKIAEVSQSHISEIESGVKRVGLEITKKLANALDVSIEELINDEEEMEEDPEGEIEDQEEKKEEE